jgi:hypothetical protein
MSERSKEEEKENDSISVDKFETIKLEFPEYQKEIIKHQRDIQISNSKALNWSSFDFLGNQIITTGDEGILYSLNLENFERKIIWQSSTERNEKIEFSQIFIHKNYIFILGTDLVILKDEKELSVTPRKSYFRSHCFFSDEEIVVIGFGDQSLKIYKFSEFLVNREMKHVTGEIGSGWIYNLVNIENQWIGTSFDEKYVLIDKNSGETIQVWKDRLFTTVLCSFYDSYSELLYLGTYEGKLVVIDVHNKLIKLVIEIEDSISWILEIASGILAISTYHGEIIILNKFTLECEQVVKCPKVEEREKSDIYHLCLVGDQLVASDESGMLSFWKIKAFNLKKLLEMLKNNKDTNVFFSFR